MSDREPLITNSHPPSAYRLPQSSVYTQRPAFHLLKPRTGWRVPGASMKAVWFLFVILLIANCVPDYVVHYQPGIVMDPVLSVKTKVEVQQDDKEAEHWNSLGVCVKAIVTEDLRESLFPNLVEMDPELSVTVSVDRLWLRAGPWGFLWLPFTVVGAPILTATYGTDISVSLRNASGSLIGKYRTHRQDMRWTGFYYNWDWTSGAAAVLVLRAALDSIKQQVIADRSELVAALGSAETTEVHNVGTGAKVDVDVGIPGGRAKNPDAIGVIIAGADYAKAPNVDYAARDAAVLRQYLLKTMGFREENIISLRNPGKADFERVFGIKGKPQGQLYNYVRKGESDVFVYYTGHGAPDLKTKEAYLVPTDAQPSYIDLQGYPLSTFYENLAQIPAKSITVVLDACFSGGYDKGLIIQQASPLVVAAAPEPGKLPANMCLLASAAGDQVSSWYQDKRHSLFTYWFLKGLQGEADANKDKSITLGEMEHYLSENVSYWAQRLHNRIQTPTFNGDENRVLARLK